MQVLARARSNGDGPSFPTFRSRSLLESGHARQPAMQEHFLHGIVDEREHSRYPSFGLSRPGPSTAGSSSFPMASEEPDEPLDESLLVPDASNPRRTRSQRRRRKEKLDRPLPPTPPPELAEPGVTELSSPISPDAAISPTSLFDFLTPEKVYSSLRRYIIRKAEKAGLLELISELHLLSSGFVPPSPVASVIESLRYREKLEELLARVEECPDVENETSDRVHIHEANIRDTTNLAELFTTILGSPEQYYTAQVLDGEDADVFMDAIEIIDRYPLLGATSKRLNPLLIQLSKRFTQLPEHLFISGVAIVKGLQTYGGTFGDIYESTYQGTRVALKRLRIFRKSDRRRIYRKFCQEARVWHRLRHPFILPFLGVDAENFPRHPCLVSPWMRYGTVMQFLKSHPRANVDKLLYEIAQGVSYLHSENIVHGDIKGANILIDDERHPCLADFGLTVLVDETEHYTTTTEQGGTMRFMAPELLDPSQFSTSFKRTSRSDMYSYACLCVELYTGQPPFGNLPCGEVIIVDRVIRGGRPDRVDSMSDELWNVVTACWNQDPAKRLTASAVVSTLKDILRRSATSSSYGGSVSSASTTSLSKTIPEEADVQRMSSQRTVTRNGTQDNTTSSPSPVRTKRPLRRARQDGEDERAYALQPIRMHADPTRLYQNLRVLQQSPSASVQVAQLKGTKTLVRIQKIVIERQTPQALRQLVDEFLAMRYLHHPNLINYNDVFKYDANVWVVTEYLVNKDALSLRTVISRNQGESAPAKEVFIKTVLRSLLEAVDYLHRHDVCHGYIKAENVSFVKSRGASHNSLPIRLKLCAMISEDDQIPTGSRRPAPELSTEHSSPSPQSDVWDIGILTLDILGYDELDCSQADLLKMVSQSNIKPSVNLFSMIKIMLEVEPRRRTLAAELLSHPFLVRSRANSS